MIIHKPENTPEYALIEIVEFNGRKYRRYPNARQASSSKYFVCSRRILHRDVYEHFFGKIPSGYHVHHMDRNPLNNHPMNLEALPESEHLSEHALSRTPEEQRRYTENLRKHRHKAYAWHKSDEGRAWHEANRAAMSERSRTIPFRNHICKQCGDQFKSQSRKDVVVFCSAKCGRENRKATGFDSENRDCEQCGAVYSTWKYGKVRCCSISCSRLLEAKRRHAGLRYDGTARPKPWSYKVVRNICDFCGEIYERTPRHPKTSFCSKGCAAKYRAMTEDKGTFVKCVSCGAFFGTRVLKPEKNCRSCKEALRNSKAQRSSPLVAERLVPC